MPSFLRVDQEHGSGHAEAIKEVHRLVREKFGKKLL
jgi:hypothetical protein